MEDLIFKPLATCPEKIAPRYKILAGKCDKSFSSAIKMKCLDCCAWEYREAKACVIVTCPLWEISNRIYKRGASDE
jgi:hypothetical protein